MTEPLVATRPMTLSEAVASGQKEIVVTSGGIITSPLVLKPGQSILCEGGVEIVFEWGVDGNAIELADGCTLDGCTLVGKWTGAADHPVTATQGMSGIAGFGVKDATIRNCRITGFHGDGIYFGTAGSPRRHCENFKVTQAIIDGCRRNAASVTAGRGVFEECTFSNSKGVSPKAGLDIEPNDAADVIDVTVRRCHSFGHHGPPYLVALSRCKTTGAVPVVRFEQCTYADVIAPYMPYRFADCFESRSTKDANGIETFGPTNSGFPARNLPVGATIVIDSVEILRKR